MAYPLQYWLRLVPPIALLDPALSRISRAAAPWIQDPARPGSRNAQKDAAPPRPAPSPAAHRLGTSPSIAPCVPPVVARAAAYNPAIHTLSPSPSPFISWTGPNIQGHDGALGRFTTRRSSSWTAPACQSRSIEYWRPAEDPHASRVASPRGRPIKLMSLGTGHGSGLAR